MMLVGSRYASSSYHSTKPQAEMRSSSLHFNFKPQIYFTFKLVGLNIFLYALLPKTQQTFRCS